MARRTDELISECGCILYPGLLIMLIDNKKSGYCQKHGWQQIIRNATSREVYNNVLGFPLDNKPIPDKPPF